MGEIYFGINLEFVRHNDKPFEWGVEKAAQLGYTHVEPMVHWGRELLSEAGYFHSVSMLDDPLRIKRACAEGRREALRPLDAHAALQTGDQRRVSQAGHPFRRRVRRAGGEHRRRPEAAVDHRGRGLHAHALHADGSGQSRRAARHPHRPGTAPAIQQTSRRPLDRIYSLVKSPAIGINFDTGNSYLCGHDPLKWLERVVDRLVHLHAKDISDEQSSAERGKVTGTPVGCACGDGVIDWPAVIEICRRAKRDIVLSVECGTVEQAGAFD